MNKYEKNENKQDLRAYYEALKEYKKDGKTYTLDEIKKELHLNNP